MRPSVRRNPWTARANGTTVPDEKNDGRPTITRSLVFEGKSHEKPALFLLDTGAETCVVSLERVQKLRLYNKIVENPDNQQMATADGTESPIRGTIMLNYWIGDFTERRKFTVMKDCCYDFILGMPFFHKYAPEIDYENRTVMVGLFNEKEEHPEYWTLRTVDTEVVPGADTRIKFARLGLVRRMCRRDQARIFIVHIRVSPRVDNDLTDDEEGNDRDPTSSNAGGGQRSGAGPGVSVASLAATSTAESARQSTTAAAAAGTTSAREGGKAVLSLDDDESWARQVDSLVREYPTVFRAPDGVINRPGFEHKIVLVENATPPKKNAYHMTPRMLAELRKQLTELIERGHIRPSNSPFGAPVIFVAKKDTDELRMCIDYRALNSITVKDSYPIPRIDQLIDILHGSGCWSKMDMASAYNQFPVHKDSIAMTGFVTRYGTYECTVMPFGLCNAPATCMRYMQHVLHDMLDTCVVVYLDDVLVYSPTREQHLIDLRNVMDKLKDADLRLKRKKCFFGVDRVEYLGHVISKDGVAMDPAKIKSILGWPSPQSVTDVRSFLGMVGYYRKFLKGFADISAPLVELTKKTVPWMWNAPQEYAFKALKEMLVSAPTLLIPDTTEGQTFIIHSDASDFAVGAVLLQDQGNGGLQPCAYYSKKMNPAERNYTVGDKEMLAMKLALSEYRIYVEGVPTVLCTDHRNNVDMLTRPAANITSRRVARWIEYMQQFGRNLKLAYIKGEENQADALSRRPDYKNIDDEDGSNDIIGHGGLDGEGNPRPPLMQLADSDIGAQLLDPLDKSKLLPAIRCNVLRVTPGGLEREIKQAYGRDPDYNNSSPEGRAFREENGLQLIRGGWYKGERMAVPHDMAVRKQILQLCHDGQSHIGENKVLASLVLRFWWPTMVRDAKSFVKECATCARAKTSTQKKYGKLHPIPIPARNFGGITMDLLHMPVTPDGFDNLLVVVCKRSKWVIAAPTTKRATTTTIIDLLQAHVIDHFGAPDTLICDNDIRFNSNEFKNFCANGSIDVRFATIYHPQTDGQTERANLTISNMLRARLRNRVTTWMDHLDEVVKAYNESVNASTGLSPHFVLYGRHPRQAIDDAVPSAYPSLTNPLLQRHQANLQLKRNTDRAAEQQAKYYNKHRRDIAYSVSDKVYVDARYMPRRGTMTKMHHRREGPFRISRVVAGGKAYVVNLPNLYNQMVGVTLSTDKLAPYREKTVWGRDNQRTEWDANAVPTDILGHAQKQGQTRRYLVRYRGHHSGLDQWVPKQLLPRELVRDYWAKNQTIEMEPVY